MVRGLGVGRYNRFVTLSRSPQQPDDADGYWEPLVPADVWCAVRPASSYTSERGAEVLVEMRYHPGVSIATRIVYEDPSRLPGQTTRELFVRSVEDVEDAHDVLRLICEEVVRT